MAKVKRKFKGLILLLSLLVIWIVVGLLGKVISNKAPVSWVKNVQAVCCPCSPAPAPEPEGCDCGGGTPGTPEAVDIDGIGPEGGVGFA